MNWHHRSQRLLLLVLVAGSSIHNTANANVSKPTVIRGESKEFSSNNYFNRQRFLQNNNKDDKNNDKDNKDKEQEQENKADIPAIQVTKSPTTSPTKAPSPFPTTKAPTLIPTPPPTKLPTTPQPTPPPTPPLTPPPTLLPATPPPTQPTGPLPLEWSTVFPLKRCEGDCDVDSDCEADLVCFQRDGGEAVPRCIGIDESRIDYCIAPWELPPPPTPLPTPGPTVPPTPFPTTAPPTLAPVAAPTGAPTPSPPPSPRPTTAAPTASYIACERAQRGEVYTTEFSVTIGYYYEVITKRTEPLLDISTRVDAMFQRFLANELVDCDLEEDSEVQGVSPAGVDNLAGSCVSQTMLARLGNNEDLICYQMQGSVEVYLSAFYFMTLTATRSGEVKELVWDTLREEINESRRKLLVDFSQGIYGLFFLSGTDPEDGIVNVLGSGLAYGGGNNVNEEPSGTSAGTIVGIILGLLIFGLLLYIGFKKYKNTEEDDEVDYQMKASVATEDEEHDSPMRRGAASPHSLPPPPPPPLPQQEKFDITNPSTWRIQERLAAAFSESPERPPATRRQPPQQQRQAPQQRHAPQHAPQGGYEHHHHQQIPRGGPGSPGKPAIEVAIPNDPNISHISHLSSEYGGQHYLDSYHGHRLLPPPGYNMSSVPGVTIDEDQFRVTGYSRMSNISTLAEQLETPAKIITPVNIRPYYEPIVRNRIPEPLVAHTLDAPDDFPRFRAGQLSHYEQRSNQQWNSHRGNSPQKLLQSSTRDVNESHTTHSSSKDSFGFPKASEKSVSTATLKAPPHSTKGIPRSNYSSMTTKMANRRDHRRVPSSKIPGVQEDDRESYLSEDRLVPYYTNKPPKPTRNKPTLATLGIGARPPSRTGTDLQSVRSSKSFMSAGSFNFATLSQVGSPTQQPRELEPPTPQSEFQFMERTDIDMPDPISMALANNAMMHSAFKPRKLAYLSSDQDDVGL